MGVEVGSVVGGTRVNKGIDGTMVGVAWDVQTQAPKNNIMIIPKPNFSDDFMWDLLYMTSFYSQSFLC
jgi:hypothetical protein